jgi:uncharacterized protein DUF6279
MYKKIIIILLFFTLLLSSCKNFVLKIGYNNIDTYIIYKLNSYLNLNSSQKTVLKKKIITMKNWHRKSQLKKYKIFLSDLNLKTKDTINISDLNWIWNEYQSFIKIMHKYIFTEFIDSIYTINKSQVKHLKIKLDNFDNKLKADLKKTTDERKKENLNIFITRLEYFFGSFSKEQKNKILLFTPEMTDILPARYKFYRDRHKKFITIIEKKNNKIEIEKNLKIWLLKYWDSRPDYYKKQMKDLYSIRKIIIIYTFNNILTKEQKTKFHNKMKELIDLINNLEKK